MSDDEICDVCEVAMENEDCECDDCCNHTCSTFGSLDGCTKTGTRGVLMYALNAEFDFVEVATFESEAAALKVVNEIDDDPRVHYVWINVDGHQKTFNIRERN